MSGLFGGQTITTREERLSGVRIQSSTYGTVIPVYYGPNRATPNVLWVGDWQVIERQTSQGGKGGGGVTSISYTYKTALMLGLGEGDCSVVSVMPNKDGWQAPADLGLEVFAGMVGQTAWGHLTTNHPDEAIGYSGTAYLAASAYDLGNGGALPNFSVKLTGNPGISGLGEYITDFLTATRYGAGFPYERLAGLVDVDTYLAAQGVEFSPFAAAQQEAAAYLREWCAMANCETVWSEGLLKFLPRHATAAIAYALGPDDLLVDGTEPPVRISRKTSADAYNQLQVEYLDADHDYNVAIAEAKDAGNIELYGLRPAQPEKYHAAKSTMVAGWVSRHRLQRTLYIRNRYSFRLGWRHARLEPMDVVTLTEPLLGLVAEPVLITEVEEDEAGTLNIQAEEFNGLTRAAALGDGPTPGGPGVDHGIDPGDAAAPVIIEPPASLSGAPQVWLATSGGPDWGGCEIWASFDDATYRRIGVLTAQARHGTLRAALPSGTSPDTVNTLAVHLLHGELLAGTTQDAEDLLTLCYVDGEYLAYRDATLVAAGDYDLGYLVRGAYGSAIGAHALGVPFVRLDDALFKFGLTDIWIGRTVYLKLCSFNTWGQALQSLADVTPVTHTITGFPVVSVADLTATVFQTSITLEWTPVAKPGNYAQIEVLRSATTDPDDAVVIVGLQPNAGRYTDTIGVSGATRYYWLRLVGLSGEAGSLSTMASATTGTVGGIHVTETQPGATYLGQDVVYYSLGEDLWEWDGTAYQRAEPLVAASRIVAANLAAISADLGSITAGSINIASKFSVGADGTVMIRNASTGARLEVTNSVIKVYDSAGTLRVKLGDLSV